MFIVVSALRRDPAAIARSALPAAVLFAAVLSTACDREPGPPAPPSGDVPTPQAEGDDAPIRALYLCENRFVLINAHPFPVRVTWRVQGTDEQGEQSLR